MHKPIHFQVRANVGVGTLNPLNKLHVEGSIDLNDKDGTKSHNIENVNKLNVRDIDSNRGAEPIHFLQPFVVEIGNVGIGTMNPTAKLAVNGDIKTKEVIVTEQSSDWPDYVFRPEYPLMDLDQLKLFIKRNNHLPDMPDKNEIDKEGQKLGDLQKRLLKKIEELTLYIIRQEQRIEEQEIRNERLEKRLLEVERKLNR